MSMPSGESGEYPRFLADRMLGTLCRYLRFMGYDTASASSIREGNRKEDTLLLERAVREGRILLTRDRELARRGGERAILIRGEGVLDQVRELSDRGLIRTELRLIRCSLCNDILRPATRSEVMRSPYAPRKTAGLEFSWCRRCRRLYWMGSHGKNLANRIKEE
ncbi:MAG: Mut7-C RNAse domain-containing protein [Methanolinea sp.]|nr:Mut7-C RNAse domain-containing protein [Methanolinea sp.]